MNEKKAATSVIPKGIINAGVQQGVSRLWDAFYLLLVTFAIGAYRALMAWRSDSLNTFDYFVIGATYAVFCAVMAVLAMAFFQKRFVRYVTGIFVLLLTLGFGCLLAQKIVDESARVWRDNVEEIYAHSYQNEAVVIDGKNFDHCNFKNVTLVFRGTGRFEFTDSTFDGELKFDAHDPAARIVLELLPSLQAMAGNSLTVGRTDSHGNFSPLSPVNVRATR